jgi:outer membrane protein assembly complex protein YaeT
MGKASPLRRKTPGAGCRTRRWPLLLVLLCAGLLHSQSPAVDAIRPWLGHTIAAIEFASTGATARLQQHLPVLPLTAGQPLQREQVREAMHILYATGLFQQIRLEAAAATGTGVRLTFVCTPEYFNGGISIAGRPHNAPSEQQLANAAGLILGEPYTKAAAGQGATRIERLMQDAGYYQAKAIVEEQPEAATQQMNLLYRLQPAIAARVGELKLTGDAGLEPRRLAAITGLHGGATAGSSLTARAVQRLRRYYQAQKRLEAQITVRRQYQPQSNRLDFLLTIERGPVIDLRVEGMRLSGSRLRHLVPVFEENAVDEDLLNEGVRNLRDHLQTEGYFDATVKVVQKPSADGSRLDIVYHVERGEQSKLLRIELEGNHYLHEQELRPLLAIQPKGILFPHGRFSQSLLAQDVESLRSLYQNNGFAQATVASHVEEKPEGLTVHLAINEGRQTLVHSLAIEGSQSFAGAQLRDSLLSLTGGQPFSPANASADSDALRSFYYNHGFPGVQVETHVTPHEGDPLAADVVYVIREGQRSDVGRVLISGAEHTRPHVIARQMQVQSGDPLSQSAMLSTQSRLYSLGIFNSVDMAVQNPQGVAPVKDVLFRLQEARRLTVNYGFGFEAGSGVDVGQGSGAQSQSGVSPRLSLDVTRLNLGGTDQSIIFKSHYGRFVKRAQFTYEAPHWFELKSWRMSISGLYDDSRDVNTFASQRQESSIQMEDSISRSLKLMLRFSYRRVKVDPDSFPSGFDPTLKIIYSQPVRVGMPGFSVVRDRRDDPLDSTKGSYSTLDVGLADKHFGSETAFGRMVMQQTSYHAFGRNGAFVLARSTRLGVEMPYDNTTVPLPEHLFAGGGNTLRSFSLNQAGPRDLATGGPLGGDAMIVNNLELRLPPAPLPFFQEHIGFVFFHDMGNVFATSNEMFHSLARWRQKDPSACRDLSAAGTCNFNFISHAVGTGVRYKTPIGPVRFDLGYNLNPATFPVKEASGNTAPHVETMRRFNFFFSIGQTF